MMPGYAKDAVVDTDWVVDHLGDDSIRVVEVDEDLTPYTEGHIPGAIGLDWKQDLHGSGRSMLEPAEFGQLVGGKGISNRHTVVLYGDHDNWFAAYAYWCFVYYGHDDVRLLDGGRAKWLSEGRATDGQIPRYPAVPFEAKLPEKAIRARSEDVRDALEGDARIVDVRTPREFSGELTTMPGYEDEGPERSGHVPGAVSAPWSIALNEDGTFKPAQELRQIYAASGALEGGKPVIAYCLLGGRSAHTWFVLHELLGVDDVASYDGGWAEWGDNPELPAECDV